MIKCLTGFKEEKKKHSYVMNMYHRCPHRSGEQIQNSPERQIPSREEEASVGEEILVVTQERLKGARK